MTPAEMKQFVDSHRWAIEATSTVDGQPQAAIIGIAMSDSLEIVFDTLSTSRKAVNLRTNSRMAMVIGGWNDEDPRTLQIEGEVDFPQGDELKRLADVYYSVFADGPSRLEWPELVYVRLRPRWARFSDYLAEPPVIEEFDVPVDQSRR
jgi:hypothetical protein